MKKLFILISVVFMSFLLVSCKDRKTTDDSVNVIFYTYIGDMDDKVTYYNVEIDSKIDKPDDPQRVGYLFDGWFKELTHVNEWNFATDTIGDKSIVLYAKWISAEFNITYVVNGGQMPATYPETFVVGERKTLPRPTNKTGYTFMSWYGYAWLDANGRPTTKPGDRGYQLIPSDKAEDLILHAHWKAIIVSLEFNLNLPSDMLVGPEKPKTITVEYDSIIDFPTFADFEDTKYRFKGWNTSADATGIWLVNGEKSQQTQITTAYAIWELK